MDHGGRLGALGRVVSKRLQMPADHRDGRSQLVPDVGQELFLVLERGLETVEHAVEGAPKLGDLIAAAHGDAVREVGVGDGSCCPCECAERLDCPPSRQPDEERGQERHDDAHRDRQRDGALYLVALILEAFSRDQDA